MENTRQILREERYHEVSTVEPRLSSNRQLLSKQQDPERAPEVTEVKFPRVRSQQYFTYSHSNSSGE